MAMARFSTSGDQPLVSRGSFGVQLRVLHALLMREVITRFGREDLGVLWLVAEPMLFTLGVTSLWSLTGMHHTSSMPIVAFAVTGYSSVLLWRNSVSRASAAVLQNKQLLYHRNVRMLDVLLTRIVLEMGGATASFLVLSTLFIYLGNMPAPEDPLMVLEGWMMLVWFGMSLSVLVGAASAVSELIERLWHPISYLLFPMSGAAYMVEWMPRGMRPYLLLFPMVNGVELLRDGWFGRIVKAHHDIGYMAGVCLVLSLSGMLVQREVARRLEH
jgi:ABC-type polysaccharide/polyol phosphate export permease